MSQRYLPKNIKAQNKALRKNGFNTKFFKVFRKKQEKFLVEKPKIFVLKPFFQALP
jgi:hypothetical protein